jgi:hypothetical protein
MSCLLLAASLVLSAEPYQAYVLNTDAAVWSVAARDITGDGKAELFAACCDEKSYPLKKFVAVFIQDETGGYPANASLIVDLAPSMSALFLAETDGKPPAELVAADAEGATVFRFEGGRFVPGAAPRFSSLLPSGAKQPLFLNRLANDVNGDGIDEWIIPVPSAYEIRTADSALARVACDVASEISDDDNVNIYHRLPSCHPFLLEGEKQKCIAFLSDEFADFAYGKDWSETRRFKIPLNLEDKWQASARMADIDGNGMPDLIVTQLKGTINMKAMTHVYLSDGRFTYPAQPNATFEAEGAISSPTVSDVDGDGKRDLVFMTIPFGVKNVVNYFLRRKLSARVEVYLFKDGAFPARPTFAESALLDAPEGRERVAYALGDFNGDGRMDAAFGESADKMAIRTGSAGKLVSPRPWVVLNVPSFGVALPLDLNGNKAKDLVLYHPGGGNKKRIDVVVF